ncbi:MAG TPA: DUF3891 family protein [Candidatus Angelobacter sp.]|jgi:hypothetical protein|nr:DUF3891 family protein [Candidatus Angelobacter sp.]
MVVRPVDLAPATSKEFLAAWPVIQGIQKQKYESCWLITQPSHAALAGALAAALAGAALPKPDAKLIQAIALHDAGWGMADAQIIQMSRADSRYRPSSFLETSVPEFLSAWSKSIAAGQAVSPAGGYIVSRHFCRLAYSMLASGGISKQDREKLESFLGNEERRQKKLAILQSMRRENLELLTDLLQFCDLLSLYICCGAKENVIFPDYFGAKMRITHQPEGLVLDPPWITPGKFSFAALRHPLTKEVQGREIEVQIL